jgi:hypothetical protein
MRSNSVRAVVETKAFVRKAVVTEANMFGHLAGARCKNQPVALVTR